MRELRGDDKHGGSSGINKNLHIVIGGCGYPGSHLGSVLVEKGYRVLLVDVHEPVEDIPDEATFEKVLFVYTVLCVLSAYYFNFTQHGSCHLMFKTKTRFPIDLCLRYMILLVTNIQLPLV